jgi:hypothetical protein
LSPTPNDATVREAQPKQVVLVQADEAEAVVPQYTTLHRVATPEVALVAADGVSGLDRIAAKLFSGPSPEIAHDTVDRVQNAAIMQEEQDAGDDMNSKVFYLVLAICLFVWQLMFLQSYLKATEQYNWEKYTKKTRLLLDQDGYPRLDNEGNWQCYGFESQQTGKWEVPGQWVPIENDDPELSWSMRQPGRWVPEEGSNPHEGINPNKYRFEPTDTAKVKCKWIPEENPPPTMWRDWAELCEEPELKTIPMLTQADFFFLGVVFLDTSWIRATFSCCGRYQTRPCGWCKRPEKWENTQSAIMWLFLGTCPIVFFLVATIEIFYFTQCTDHFTPVINEAGLRSPGPRTFFPFTIGEQIMRNQVAEIYRADIIRNDNKPPLQGPDNPEAALKINVAPGSVAEDGSTRSDKLGAEEDEINEVFDAVQEDPSMEYPSMKFSMGTPQEDTSSVSQTAQVRTDHRKPKDQQAAFLPGSQAEDGSSGDITLAEGGTRYNTPDSRPLSASSKQLQVDTKTNTQEDAQARSSEIRHLIEEAENKRLEQVEAERAKEAQRNNESRLLPSDSAS